MQQAYSWEIDTKICHSQQNHCKLWHSCMDVHFLETKLWGWTLHQHCKRVHHEDAEKEKWGWKPPELKIH